MLDLKHKFSAYVRLIRLDKPVGILLLLWPTLWALWLASLGYPRLDLLLIFTSGVFLMRSAGCALNDIADRHFDAHVTRTRHRPLANNEMTVYQALAVALILSLSAFLLVLSCNSLTIKLAIIGALLAVGYPFLKRFFPLPQLGLGAAFAWGIPMAFAAVTGWMQPAVWLVFSAGVIWPLMYDTLYAMTDREDDLKIGIQSSAILFGEKDKTLIGLLQAVFVSQLILIGWVFHLHGIYYLALGCVSILFFYQQQLIKNRDPQQCFRAFLNNQWVGLIIFIGIALSI